jgi:hypothetical protein
VGNNPLSKVKRRAFKMRILAACLSCLACVSITTTSSAQGLINWANTSQTLISVGGNPMPNPIPVRSSPETTYYFGLFIAPIGTPAPSGFNDPNWQFVAAYTMNSTAAAGAGRMQNPGPATVIGYAAGTNVNFIVRGWQSTTGGADWQAAQPGLTTVGTSALGTAILGGGALPTPSAFGTGAGFIGGFSIGFGCPACIPVFAVYPTNTVASLGGNATFYAYANSSFPPIGYQWRKQGSPIPGTYSSTLTLTNVTLADAGNYVVLANNLYGSAVSPEFTLTVFIPAIPATLGSPTYTANNQFQFTVNGTAGTNYIVQVSTNLATANWVSLFTNATPFTFIDTNAHSFTQRFYRAYAP